MNKRSPYKNEGMFAGANPLLFALAKNLRQNMTDAEIVLWEYLRQGVKGLKFRRQHPVGIYIADFYCHKLRLIIELDGSIHDLQHIKDNDEIRQKDLENWGYKIIRFTNYQVLKEIEKVREQITRTVETSISNNHT